MKSLILVLALCLSISAQTHGDEKVPPDNLVLLPVTNDPTVSFRIWFKVGSQDDPPGKEGLASIVGDMMTDASTMKHS